jgi:hypothetical protein
MEVKFSPGTSVDIHLTVWFYIQEGRTLQSHYCEKHGSKNLEPIFDYGSTEKTAYSRMKLEDEFAQVV